MITALEARHRAPGELAGGQSRRRPLKSLAIPPPSSSAEYSSATAWRRRVKKMRLRKTLRKSRSTPGGLNGTSPRRTVSGMVNSRPSQATNPMAAIMPKQRFPVNEMHRAAPESGPTIGATSTTEVITSHQSRSIFFLKGLLYGDVADGGDKADAWCPARSGQSGTASWRW